MTNREKFKEIFNKDIYWSRAIEPQILALKSAHIDGIDCMEEWLNSEYEPKKKTAAWVPTDEEPHEVYECNACGWLLYDVDRTDFKYCPNCGARMVSE